MAQFGNGNYNASTFDEVFSKYGIYENQVYAGGLEKSEYEYKLKNLKSSNKAFNQYLKKDRGTTTSEYASGTSYSSTSGSLPTLLPIYVSPDIISLSQKASPLYEMLPKQAVRGKFYDWNTSQFASTNAQFLPEGAALPVTDDTFSRLTKQVKYCYAVGAVTGPMQVHARGYIDMEREEIMNKTRQLIQKIENEIVDGATSSNQYGFNGLGAEISTNSTAVNGALSISAMRTMIRQCTHGGTSQSDTVGGMRPNMMIGGLAVGDDLKALYQSYIRYNEPVVLSFGYTATEFEGIPFIPSTFMTDTSSSKVLYFINTRVVRMGIAQDITFERLAKTDDSNKFMIKWYGVLLVLAEQFCGELTSIT